MITEDSCPIDIAYHQVHEELMNLICGASAVGDIQLKWRAARSLLAVEKMMGTARRFGLAMRGIAFSLGKGKKKERRPAADMDLLLDSLERGAQALGEMIDDYSEGGEGPSFESLRRAKSMMEDGAKALVATGEQLATSRITEAKPSASGSALSVAMEAWANGPTQLMLFPVDQFPEVAMDSYVAVNATKPGRQGARAAA